MVSYNLAFRQSANDLFDYINSLKESSIKLDFSDVNTISGSFAHQYMIHKRDSKKQISESNMASQIKKMFDVVRSRKERPELFIEPPRVIEVTN